MNFQNKTILEFLQISSYFDEKLKSTENNDDRIGWIIAIKERDKIIEKLMSGKYTIFLKSNISEGIEVKDLHNKIFEYYSVNIKQTIYKKVNSTVRRRAESINARMEEFADMAKGEGIPPEELIMRAIDGYKIQISRNPKFWKDEFGIQTIDWVMTQKNIEKFYGMYKDVMKNSPNTIYDEEKI